MFTSGKNCVVTCPSPEFGGASGRCEVCDSTCDTCTDGGASDCLSCSSGLLLQPDKSCQASCIPGTYLNGNTCEPCGTNCKTCDKTTQDCTECFSPFKLKVDTSTCTENLSGECPVPYFNPPSSPETCERCFTGCVVCNGPSVSEC